MTDGSFKDLAKAIRALASVPARASKTAARGIYRLAMSDFDREHDPYGTPWAPLKPSTEIIRRRLGYAEGPILTRSGDMRRSLTVKPLAGSGIAFVIAADYAVHHQYGFVHKTFGVPTKVPARPMFPKRGLPPSWRRVIDAAVRKAYGDAMKKGGGT